MKVFTAFTGIGSTEMAIRNIGIKYNSVGISEVDKHAIIAFDSIHCNNEIIKEATKEDMLKYISEKNISYNFSTNKSELPRGLKEIKKLYDASIRSKNYGDIRGINESALPDFDLFTYSFPCKNISVAGKQAGLIEGSNTQSSLLWECERIIQHKKPKYLLMENVKNLIGKNHIADFKLWINRLSELGYISNWSVLNGKDFNVPQNRERVMMVSIREDIFTNDYLFPEGKECTISLKDIMEKDVPDSMFMPKHRYKHIIKDLQRQEIAYCIDVNYHKGASIETFVEKRKRTLVQVGLLDNKLHSNKRIYSVNGISPTLNSMNGGNRQPKIYEYSRVRKLTPLECWRCMGYSDSDFQKAKNAGLSNSKLYERAGRGIVLPMLEAIFYNLFKGVGDV